MLVMKNIRLKSEEALTLRLKKEGIEYWQEAMRFVQHLPYGRNVNRTDFLAVIHQRKGTCSSKHALLYQVALDNDIPNVHLILGIYKMNGINTPKVSSVLQNYGLEYLPEAHCYLEVEGEKIDLTSPSAAYHNFAKDVLEEQRIEPKQVGDFKVNYHKAYCKRWMKERHLSHSFDALWSIREQCILALS